MDIADLNILSDSSPLVMKGLFAGRSQTGRPGLKRYGAVWGEITENVRDQGAGMAEDAISCRRARGRGGQKEGP
jgi:hypothetical protein